jgi:signal transduction histidine kinase
MTRMRNGLRTLLYLVTAVPMGAAGAAVLLAGWIVSLVLAITPLVVPALAGFRWVVAVLARAEAWLARTLIGAAARPPVRERYRGGYWRHVPDVLADDSFWRQQAFLLLRYVLGGALAIVELSLIAAALGAITQPIYYRWSNADIGSWHVDTLGRALLFVPAGIIVLVAAVYLLRPLAALWRSLADGLLGDDVTLPRAQPSAARRNRMQALAIASVAMVGISAIQVVIWAATSHGYFWPAWTIITLGVALALYGWIVFVLEKQQLLAAFGIRRGIAIHAGAALAFSLYFIAVWALSSHGYFWPVWPMLVLLASVIAHVAAEVIRAIRAGGLSERIAVLEQSRAGAVDYQDSELRRIERDLHDGAQARLVALGMSLGLAEQKFASDPAGAQQLLADARRGAHEALEELRDLARGIHPPVLADRGLEAAIAALASRTPLHVRVSVDIDTRPSGPVESAAYFVVAEALANIGKHAHAEHVDIVLRRRRDTLVVEIVDDGIGGADRSGTGLTGLARRVEALDGTLEITSPPGGPTTVKATVPCAS